jgi:hypothetical protein
VSRKPKQCFFNVLPIQMRIVTLNPGVFWETFLLTGAYGRVYSHNHNKFNTKLTIRDGAGRAISQQFALPPSGEKDERAQERTDFLVTVNRSALSPEISN